MNQSLRRRLALLLLCLAPAAAGAQSLPEGTGRATVVTTCASACHGAGPIATARFSRDRWQEIVDDMVSKGAEVKDADRQVIVSYLAQQLGAAAETRSTPRPAQDAVSNARPAQGTTSVAVSGVTVLTSRLPNQIRSDNLLS